MKTKGPSPKLRPFPNVFLDIEIEREHDRAYGRIELKLYPDCPLTSENFRCLCTGEKGIGKSGKKLHFKDTYFHRIVPEFMI